MDSGTLEFVIGHLNYWLFILLMMTGLYIVVAKGNSGVWYWIVALFASPEAPGYDIP